MNMQTIRIDSVEWENFKIDSQAKVYWKIYATVFLRKLIKSPRTTIFGRFFLGATMIRALFLTLVTLISIAALRQEDKDLEHIKNFALLTTFQVRANVDSNTETTTKIVHTKKPDLDEAKPEAVPEPVTVEKPYPVPVPIYIRVPVYVPVPRNHLEGSIGSSRNHLEGLIGSYVPSKSGGTYRTGFNRFQTVEYQKTW